MFRYNTGRFKQTPPATVDYNGFNRKFTDLTREQWDELGYNEAIPIRREPFITYEVQWMKGEDLIYREEVVSEVVDEEAKAEAKVKTIRIERDTMLTASDWTQLADSTLDAEDMVLWQGYRQALRDVPQQPGFPLAVEWPERPMTD